METQATEIKTVKDDVKTLKEDREQNKLAIIALQTNQTTILETLAEIKRDIKDLIRRK
jgi:hypothetical protein